MMLQNSADKSILLHRTLYFLTAFTIFINPLLEAPKNIGMGLTLLTFIAWTIKTRSYSFKGWDIFFLLFLIAPFIGIPFASEPTKFGVVGDLLRYTLFGWIVYRAGFSETQRLGVAFWATLGTVVGLIYGAWAHYIQGVGDFWTLNSVGHVNHAAIYNAIITGMAFTALLTYWRTLTLAYRMIWLAMLALCLLYVITGESRATFGAVFAMMLALGLVFARKNIKILFGAVGAIALLIAVALLADVRVVAKQETNNSQNIVLSYRDTIWKAGLESAKQHPLFGVGKENFSSVYIAGEGFTGDNHHSSHAHNIYVNTLAETGIWGLGWLLALFGGVGISLLRYLPGKTSSTAHWAAWGFGASGLSITLIVGLVNTTFHHEHGNLAMLCFALWLVGIRQVREQKQPQ